MRPRAATTLVFALSAAIVALAAASPAQAQEPAPTPAPARRSAWVMPGNLPAIAVAAPAPTQALPPPTQALPPATPALPAPSPELAVAPPSWPTFVREPTYSAQNEAPAPTTPKPRNWAIDLGVATEIPISVGGLVTVELPYRLLLQLGVGVLPTAYSDAIDGFLTRAGAYDAVVSSVFRGSLGNSLVVRASGGVRPFPRHGFEMFGGYTLMTMGGSVATSDIINAILLESGSALQAPAGLGPAIPLSTTLHNVHASIGWRWLLADDHLVVRASLSYLQTLHSEVSIKVPESAGDLVQYEALANRQVNAFLNPYFAKYGKVPTLGLSAAFRF